MQTNRISYPESFYQMNLYADDWSIQSVIEAFQEQPIAFESLCADLLERMGYTVVITNPRKDGGYDLEIWKRMTHCIVECKCYPITTKISRPQLQKLIGANAIKQANGTWFITTSDYTKEAIEYAKAVGMILINGSDFEHWMRAHFSC